MKVMNKGVAVIYNTDISDEYDVQREIVMVATYRDNHKPMLFSNEQWFAQGYRAEKHIGAHIEPLDGKIWQDEFGNADISTLIGYDLHDALNGNTFDLLHQVKQVSADYLQNNGKRFALEDLVRWNGIRSKPMMLLDNIRKEMAYKKGQMPKLAKVAINEAKMCLKLYQKVIKTKKVRFLDANTGKKPACVVSWGEFGEEE
jgi:hypothetical protein